MKTDNSVFARICIMVGGFAVIAYTYFTLTDTVDLSKGGKIQSISQGGPTTEVYHFRTGYSLLRDIPFLYKNAVVTLPKGSYMVGDIIQFEVKVTKVEPIQKETQNEN